MGQIPGKYPAGPLIKKECGNPRGYVFRPANWEELQIFAITLDGKVIGEVAINRRDEDRRNERAELVYTLSRQHWGKGLMTEAARTVMNWAFRTYSFNRMFAFCDPRNIGSRRVLEKLGMKYEGQLRSHLKWNDEFRDQVYFGILRVEWKSSKTRS